MSASIDERVVSMKFKSDGFQSGVSSTKKALQDLKTNLNFDKAKASLASFKGESGRFNLNGMQDTIQNLASRFDALRVAGVTALATLASQAVMYGQKLVQGLLSPIKQGLDEYETNLNSIQTILANTQTSGAGLKEVNAALDELNTYSDKTIYNFSEMARNIGTFTAAGVNLDASTAAIKGIANLAALSGSNSQQASSAMYQLSQALASGKVGLQDWNSVVNAGMGGTVFQRALAQTAVKMGTLSEGAVSLTGDMKNVKISGESFRDSISATGGKASWLTSDVLTKTLNQFTGDMTDAQLASEGFSKSQIQAIQQQAKTAQEAATEVKTFSQLMGTLAEAQGSGWSTSFKLIFGDFEQAKKLWTGVSNELGAMVGNSAQARNKILADWQKAGGRDAVIKGVVNLWKTLLAIIKPIKEAFQEIFPPATGQMFADMSMRFLAFTAALRAGLPATENIKSTFKGFFAILHIGWSVIKGVLSLIGRLFGAIFSGSGEASGGLFEFTGSIGDFLVKIDQFLTGGNVMTDFFGTLGTILTAPIKAIKFLAGLIGDFFGNIKGFNLPDISDAFGRLFDRLDSFKVIGKAFGIAGTAVGDFFSMVGKWMEPGLKAIGEFGKKFGKTLHDSIKSGDFSAVLDLINTGFIAGIFLLFRGFFKNFKKLFSKGGEGGGGILGSFKEIFEGVTDTLGAMQAQLKAKTLITIAIAIALLAASVIALSLVDSKRLTSALIAITVMFGQLAGVMALFSKVAGMGGIAKIPILAGAMIILGVAILILATAVKSLAKLDWNELAKGLTGVTVLMGVMVGAAAGLKSQGPGMIVSAASMVILAAAIKILASAVGDFAELNWEEIARGITSVAAVLAAVIIFNKLSAANKGAAISAINIVLLGSAMKLFAASVGDFAKMDTGSLIQGLTGVGVVLGMLVAFTKTAGNPVGMVATGAAIVILGAAMKVMASAVTDFKNIGDWNELARGITGFALSLAVVVTAMRLMPKKGMLTAAVGMIAIGAALKIMASAMKSMGKMSWEEIGKSMVVLAGSLIILAGAMYLMEATLPGAAALIVAAGALALMVGPLTALGKMTWGEIGAAMGALGIGLAILAVGGVALLPAIPGLVGLGFALGLIGLGIGAAALGLGVLAIGLVAIGTAGPLAGQGITSIATAILDLLPLAMTKLGEGIVAFADVIGNSGPTLVAAFTTLIQSLLDSINTLAPQILTTLTNLILNMLIAIDNNMPQFVSHGASIIIKFINGLASKNTQLVNAVVNWLTTMVKGIGDNSKKLVDAGGDAIIKFITALGSKGVEIANAAGDVIVDFVDGIADAVTTHSEELKKAGKKLALAIADGMSGGLASKAEGIASKAWDLGKKAISSIKKAVDSNSPSKEAMYVGEFVGDGFGIGIENMGSKVEKSASGLGKDSISAMRSAMSGVNDLFNTSDVSSPTIRPILDLSSVQQGANKINGMMGVPSVKATASYASASAAETGYSVNREAAQAAATPTVIDNSKVFELKQENTSPQALDAGEIYRNTRSLLSQIEEELSI